MGWINKYKFHLIFATFFAILILIALGFGNGDLLTEEGLSKLELSSEELVNNGKREEIHRYFGYEKLLYRYITLPFDISLNINQIGRFSDIGFLYLLFLPLLFLSIFTKSRKLIFALIVSLFLFLVICLHNSHIVDYANKRSISSEADLTAFYAKTKFFDAPFTTFLVWFKTTTTPIYQAIDFIVDKISGDKDYITFPLITLLLIYLVLLLLRSKEVKNSSLKVILFLIFVYGFFWLTLSAGIIWYGFVMLAMAGIAIVVYLHNQEKNSSLKSRMNYYFSFSVVIAWLTIASFSRISSVPPMMRGNEAAKSMLQKNLSDYSIGKLESERELIDAIHPNLSATLDLMNSEKESKVYKIGTSLNYFIKNNHERLFSDNQMVFFQKVVKKYKDKEKVVEVLKASGFKYLIVDLNIQSIDNTPEKTLTEKFKVILNIISNNPRLQLLNTDRIVEDPENTHSNGRFGVFGYIKYNGSHAIYRIQ